MRYEDHVPLKSFRESTSISLVAKIQVIRQFVRENRDSPDILYRRYNSS